MSKTTSKPAETKAASVAPAPVVEENPVPATERDTPILIQGKDVAPAPASAPEPTAVVTQLAPVPVVPTVEVTVKTPEAPAPKSKAVKVRFLRSHPSFGYFAGDEAEISQADFDKHQKDGPFFEKL